MGDTIILLGMPCVGKSTFSYSLKQKMPDIRQFSVRLFTQQLMNDKTPLGLYLMEKQLVRPKEYMPDDVVEEVFSTFLKTVSLDQFLLIEGYPINETQFFGMKRQLARVRRSVAGVFILEDNLDRIWQRLQRRKICPACELKNGAGLPILLDAEACPYCGGPLSRRPEDSLDFFQERCQKFENEMRFFSRMFPENMIHHINVSTESPLAVLDDWLRKRGEGGK